MDGLYHTILDRRELQKIQNDFCAATGIYAFCVGSDGAELTDMSGSDWDKERLTGQIPRVKWCF